MASSALVKLALALGLLLGLSWSQTSPPTTTITTTDSFIADVEGAAALDINFIDDDIHEIVDMIFTLIHNDLVGLNANISESVTIVMDGDLPSNWTGYDADCLRDVIKNAKVIAFSLVLEAQSCANTSQAMTRTNATLNQFQQIYLQAQQSWQDLIAGILSCKKRYPEGWKMITCVFQEVDVEKKEIAPWFSEFKDLNEGINDQLMALGLEMDNCLSDLLGSLPEVNKTVIQDVASCKLPTKDTDVSLSVARR